MKRFYIFFSLSLFLIFCLGITNADAQRHGKSRNSKNHHSKSHNSKSHNYNHYTYHKGSSVKSVVPILECVKDNGDGTYTATWGYWNKNSYSIKIPKGKYNCFYPGSDKGQIEYFKPGRQYKVFKTTYKGSCLTWAIRTPKCRSKWFYCTAKRHKTKKKIEPLKLEPVCSNDPDEYRRWKVTNPNDVSVNFLWKVLGTKQWETEEAAPGESYFETEEECKNIVAIFWRNEKKKVEYDASRSTEETCEARLLCLPKGGAVDFARVYARSSMDVKNNFTFEGWIKPTNDGEDTDYQTIFEFNDTKKLGAHFQLDEESQTFHANLIDVNGNWHIYEPVDSEGDPITWEYDVCIHVALVRDGANVLFYINGVPYKGALRQFPNNSALGENTELLTNLDLIFGARLGIGENSEDTYPFNGTFDEFRLWNDVRTESEINTYMSKELTGNESNLVGYWNFNYLVDDPEDPSNWEIYDGSKYENDGYLYPDATKCDGFLCPSSNEGRGKKSFDDNDELLLAEYGIQPDAYFSDINIMAYPNPFTSTTMINYNLSVATHVTVSVYNLQGEVVNTLVDADLAEGNHEVSWNGNNSAGIQLNGGVYIIKVIAEGQNPVTQSIMLAR